MNATVPAPVFLSDGQEGLDQLYSILSEFNARFSILADSHTVRFCVPLIRDVIPQLHHVFEIPAGERSKNLATCETLWKQMLHAGITRNDLLLCIGGGVVTDTGAFVASMYKRGIKFIHIPTSLLAMVDAAIGGKTGVDLDGYKNMIGTFSQAESVIIHTRFLDTLPEREIYNGRAEIIKHALIADADLWNQINTGDLNYRDIILIKQAADIKLNLVRNDPFEQSSRKKLNFGHTIGHAIESWNMKQGNDVSHGEAIAAGMIAETILSVKSGLNESDVESVTSYLLNIFGNTLPLVPGFDDLLPFMQADKKNNNKEISFSLLDKIGSCIWDCKVPHDEIRQVVDNLRAHIAQHTSV